MCWRGDEQFIQRVRIAISSPRGQEARHRKISAETFLAIARAVAGYIVDGILTAAHATLAAAAGGWCSKTVQRFHEVCAALGLFHEVTRGRYTRVDERAQAKKKHGDSQLRIASTRIYVAGPEACNDTVVHLLSEGELMRSSRSEIEKHQRASSQEGADASRPHSPYGRSQESRGPSTRSRVVWGREMFEFARDIRDGLAALQGIAPASVAKALDRAGCTPDRWAAKDLLRHLEVELSHRANAAQFGGTAKPAAFRFMDAGEPDSPLGYLRWLLAEYVDVAQPTRTEDRRAYLADRAISSGQM